MQAYMYALGSNWRDNGDSISHASPLCLSDSVMQHSSSSQTVFLESGDVIMLERLNLIGAQTAHVVFISTIITFSSRMIFKIGSSRREGRNYE
jgi:hypothetical protein